YGLQIEVKEDAVLDVAGTLFLLDDVPVVTIRASDARVRQRFTLAHEIGHLMLHERGQHFRDKNFLSGDPREIEANRYAAELLMPSWMIEPAASKYRADSGILARLFDVSEQAMNIRLQMIAGFR
ncbi:MAG TPA: ImmA/IrrE family metallo-endopeptidase, partial [Myxococcaceae bacterium]|nr:ImmA/IrrE family metallo-endopeptidase [Myxococcaceae bacterium]